MKGVPCFGSPERLDSAMCKCLVLWNSTTITQVLFSRLGCLLPAYLTQILKQNHVFILKMVLWLHLEKRRLRGWQKQKRDQQSEVDSSWSWSRVVWRVGVCSVHFYRRYSYLRSERVSSKYF